MPCNDLPDSGRADTQKCGKLNSESGNFTLQMEVPPASQGRSRDKSGCPL